MKCLLTYLIMLVCFAGSISYAQGQENQTDVSAVKDTISKIHAAISSLDISKMEPLWFHNAYVMLVINPVRVDLKYMTLEPDRRHEAH